VWHCLQLVVDVAVIKPITTSKITRSKVIRFAIGTLRSVRTKFDYFNTVVR